MSNIKNWSTTALNNNAAAPDGFPEGMAPSDVNNACREVMAAVRVQYDDSEWRDWGHTVTYGSATTFSTSVGDGDTTAIYHTTRRVKAVGTITGTIYGAISGSVFTTNTTVTVVWDSGSLSNEALEIFVGADATSPSIAAGAVITDPAIPTATVMAFFQASVPTGWTQVVTQNNKALRVVSGTGGGAGGTHGLSSPPSTAHQHTGPSHQHTGPNHQHAGPSHNHAWLASRLNSYNSGGTQIALNSQLLTSSGIEYSGGSEVVLNGSFYTANGGTGQTGLGGTGQTGLSGTGLTNNTGPTAFAPQYIDVVIGSKD